MVRALILSCSLLLFSLPSFALLEQTRRDLRAVEDRLRYEFAAKEDGGRGGAPPLFPMLVAPAQAHWKESQADFAAEMRASVARVFPQPGVLIDCQECYANRTFIARDNRMVVQSGEITLADLLRLKAMPAYRDAKSLLLSRETPSGIELLVLSADDGRILYAGVEDASRSLADAEPPLRLARELERRERGEGLSYVWIDAGLLPAQSLDLKWLEQWGSRNQNLSGFVISLYNPVGGVGGSYHYMLPFNRRMSVGLTVLYELRSVFESSSTDDAFGSFTTQLSFNYAFSGAYGVFAWVDTKGTALVGFSFLNPVLFPFLF